MQQLDELVDASVYGAVLASQPALVAAVTELVKAGQTPAEIELRMIATFGRNQTTRNVRHIAEHVARTS